MNSKSITWSTQMDSLSQQVVKKVQYHRKFPATQIYNLEACLTANNELMHAITLMYPRSTTVYTCSSYKKNSIWRSWHWYPIIKMLERYKHFVSWRTCTRESSHLIAIQLLQFTSYKHRKYLWLLTDISRYKTCQVIMRPKHVRLDSNIILSSITSQWWRRQSTGEY